MMADDDQQDNQQDNQDEYQFADLDVLGTEQDAVSSSDLDLELDDDTVGNNAGHGGEGVSSPPGRGRFDHLDPKLVDTFKKGLIAVAALILVLLIYKGVTGFFSSKSSTSKKTTTSSASTRIPAEKSVPQQPILSTLSTTDNNTAAVSADTGTLSALKSEQKQIEEELVDIRTQINTVTQSISDVSTKMTDVQQTMLVLSERLEQQSQQMGRLQTLSRSKRVTSSRSSSERQRTAAPRTVYAIQAIIPGRAWLMSDEGKSLTVSRGSPVPGYGSVRIVNAKLGRVFTSSGRVIRFSQADS
jgi:intracellular multiplication protein IcmG